MGAAVSAVYDILDQGYPPKSKFTPDDIPDLTGKVIIVTGGNTGIGKETIKVCFHDAYGLLVISRTSSRFRRLYLLIMQRCTWPPETRKRRRLLSRS
jgi:hypothetical protein